MMQVAIHHQIPNVLPSGMNMENDIYQMKGNVLVLPS